jgi:hypothetical protein
MPIPVKITTAGGYVFENGNQADDCETSHMRLTRPTPPLIVEEKA